MDDSRPIVRVTQGTLAGVTSSTQSGGPLVSFRSVPYAKPPVGCLRFKPPQPLDPWDGTLEAQKEPPICSQYFASVVSGQEDCLYLNVHTSNLRPQNPLPVMIWIHGGGFVGGSGNSDLFGPDYLVDAGVVLVTFNYRLGVLGFLSLDNEDVSGNMGLKDQVAVLRWVKQNINCFGGDCNNITLFGESAGSVCVSYHMISPMSKGLFNRAIAMSGSFLNPWAFTTAFRDRAFRLGELLGCKTTDPKVLFNYLQEVDVEKLVKESENVLPDTVLGTSGLKIPFLPTTETVLEGQEAFLTRHPGYLLKNGYFQKVPYITGMVCHEGVLSIRGILKDLNLLKIFDNRFELIIPGAFKCNSDEAHNNDLGKRIKSFYFKNQPLSEQTLLQLLNFYSDAQIASGVHLTAKYITRYSTEPVYLYNFSFDGELGFTKKVMQTKGSLIVKGSYHGDDIGYLFRMGLYNPDLHPSSLEVKVRKQLITLWTNFASTGNPTPRLSKDVPIQWLPFTEENEEYLKIDKEMSMEKYIFKERMEFWENIYRAKL